MEVNICTFYRFIPLESPLVTTLQANLEELARETQLRGLVLLGREGINATVAGSATAIALLKRASLEWLGVDELNFKDSTSAHSPFLNFKVKQKSEIVSLGNPERVPKTTRNHHLSPSEWRTALGKPDTLVLDTRNAYEVEIGKFRGAQDFALAEFNEFPARLKNANLDKNKTVLIYCTGGIRCEKALLEMNEQGFDKVFQLDGGILNYLAEYPEQDFEGECFVFDYRVAVDQKLQPTTQYRLCPQCGQPADHPIECVQCGRPETICANCYAHGPHACSKNCAHHHTIGSASRKTHLPELKKRQRPE